MRGENIDDVRADSLELARALFASVHQEHENYASSRQGYIDVETLQSIDGLLRETTRVVRGLLNGARPVNRLPPEILLKIFAEVAGAWIAPGHRSRLTPFQSQHMVNSASLLPLTAVCSRWRALALNTPSLWSTLVDTTPSASSLRTPPVPAPAYSFYAHRCKWGPLYLAMTGQRPIDGLLDILQKDGARVREVFVDWSLGRGMSPEATDSFLLTSLPALERCYLLDVTRSSPGPEPQNLFVDTPRLRTLELFNITFIPSNSYPQLTHLTLHCGWIPGDSDNPPLEQLLGLLSRSPQLQVLKFGDLHHLLPVAADLTSLPSTGTVQLRRLRCLGMLHGHKTRGTTMEDLSAHYERIHSVRERLLSVLAIPRSCKVWLGRMTVQQLQSSVELLTSGWTGAAAQQLELKFVTPTKAGTWTTYYNGPSFNMTLSGSGPCGQDSVPMGVGLSLEYCGLHVSHVADTQARRSTFREVLCTTLSMSSHFEGIRRLRLAWLMWQSTSVDWLCGVSPHHILCALPHLESLLLTGQTSSRESKLQSLKVILQPLEITGDEPIACPALERLWIEWLGDSFDEEYSPPTILDYLRAMAHLRAQRGSPFSRVTIVRSRIPSIGQPIWPSAWSFLVDEYDGDVAQVVNTTGECDYCTMNRLRAGEWDSEGDVASLDW
ncbi:hypothetical protein OH77DRAFT_1586517 [Trametes cingulata]|nr:hypothetical protein OH77DRAFT_1586517 [Trametes cingulata]